MGKYKYLIEDLEMPTEMNGEGSWCGYRLDAEGNTAEEFTASASVTAVDQDGGDIWTVPLDKCESPLSDDAEKLIQKEIHAVMVDDIQAMQDKYGGH